MLAYKTASHSEELKAEWQVGITNSPVEGNKLKLTLVLK